MPTKSHDKPPLLLVKKERSALFLLENTLFFSSLGTLLSRYVRDMTALLKRLHLNGSQSIIARKVAPMSTAFCASQFCAPVFETTKSARSDRLEER